MSRTCKVLRRTIPVLRRIKTQPARRSPQARAIARQAPRDGLVARISQAWHNLCIERCQRINVDPPRVQTQKCSPQYQGQDNGVPRIQSSTGFAGRRFYFRNRFARPQTATLEAEAH
jgi:hypothetical protein